MSIVTLCGSVQFRDLFDAAERELVEHGHVPLSCCWAFDREGISPPIKAALDAIHMQKIQLSDLVLVIDQDGYTGESTAREIAFAKLLGKPVQLLSRSDLNCRPSTPSEDSEE